MNTIKFIVSLILIFFICNLILFSTAYARRGCCSHHGGVCSYSCSGGGIGHSCCDGTPLSAKCAPYYSQCSYQIPTTPAVVCDAHHPNLCTTETDCTGAGLNWCNGACQVAACPIPTCDASHPDLCTTQADCIGAGLNWYNGQCQVSPCPALCDASHPNLCTTETDCTGAGLNWCNGHCQIEGCANEPPVIASFTARPTFGNAPLTVTLTCNAHDPDGTVASYKWDFDGDGTVDQTSSDESTTYTYANTGTYQVKITVVDDGGASTTSSPVTVTVTIPQTCDTKHPNLCSTETDCTGAGLNWCNGQCQVSPCPANISISSTLNPQYNDGTGTLDPKANLITITEGQKTDVSIAPVLKVPAADQGKTVNLYAIILAGNRLYVTKKSFLGAGVSWDEYTGGAFPSFKTTTLSATQKFNVGLNNMDLSGLMGSFDIYYGYATKANLSDFVGASYELDFE